MNIRAEIWDNEKATLFGPFPFPFIKLINALSGRKRWEETHTVKIEATPNNLRILKECDHPIEFVDKTGQMTAQQIIENMPTQHAVPDPLPIEYVPGIPFYDHQARALGLSWDREWYALLFDVGLGKTAIIIANAALLFSMGKVTGVLVLAPKGPHRQWIEEELPKHISPAVPWEGTLWKKKRIVDWHRRARNGLSFFVMNTDAIRTKIGLESATAFLKAHNGKAMLVVDESSDFKSNNSDRTYNLFKLKELAAYRRIADGTPISKNVVDLWAQFNFLDERILGMKYLTAYKQRFCITKPGDNATIVGHKNIEELYSLIAPHSFRMRQEEAVDLPEKIYSIREYDMSEETEKYYKQIKETLLAEMEDGTIVDAVNPAVALLRLHQIVCGFLPSEEDDEDGCKVLHRFGGERIAEMMKIVRQVEGPVITWARFIPDRQIIAEALEKEGEGYVIYEGSDDMRAAARADFMAGRKRHFISNQKTGGVGNNLQGACRNVIFYSQSFQARLRWQAEGRTTRIGTLGTVNHFDLVARKSVDRKILTNLRIKKDLADLTLDDIRRAIVSD